MNEGSNDVRIKEGSKKEGRKEGRKERKKERRENKIDERNYKMPESMG